MNFKTLLFPLLIALAACSNNANDDNPANDELSDAAFLDVKMFRSYDLELNELHSKVAVALITSYKATKQDGEIIETELIESDTLYFDETGMMTREVNYSNVTESVSRNNVYLVSPIDKSTVGTCANYDNDGKQYDQSIKVIRNTDGQIIMREFISPDFDYTKTNNSQGYQWKDGRIAVCNLNGWNWDASYRYTYDSRGLRATTTSKYYGNGNEIKNSISYRYTTFDKCNNWTRRIVTNKKEATYTNQRTGKRSDSSSTEFTIEHRNMIYYK